MALEDRAELAVGLCELVPHGSDDGRDVVDSAVEEGQPRIRAGLVRKGLYKGGDVYFRLLSFFVSGEIVDTEIYTGRSAAYNFRVINMLTLLGVIGREAVKCFSGKTLCTEYHGELRRPKVA